MLIASLLSISIIKLPSTLTHWANKTVYRKMQILYVFLNSAYDLDQCFVEKVHIVRDGITGFLKDSLTN
jgi:hypothetical protein